jgi:hypothetical protein
LVWFLSRDMFSCSDWLTQSTWSLFCDCVCSWDLLSYVVMKWSMQSTLWICTWKLDFKWSSSRCDSYTFHSFIKILSVLKRIQWLAICYVVCV